LSALDASKRMIAVRGKLLPEIDLTLRLNLSGGVL